jgi:hypothetical protein
MMCCDTFFLGQSHIHKFIESISLNQVQTFLELCVENTTETLLFLGIIIRVIPRVLARMIKSLCILEYSAGPLCECQKFIQLLLHQSFRNMVCPEGSSKLSHPIYKNINRAIIYAPGSSHAYIQQIIKISQHMSRVKAYKL